MRRARIARALCACIALGACSDDGPTPEPEARGTGGSTTQGSPSLDTSGGDSADESTGSDPAQAAYLVPLDGSSSGGGSGTGSDSGSGTGSGSGSGTGAGTGGGGSTGTGGSDAAPQCLPQAVLDAMAEPFSCEALPIVNAPVELLPHDCHTQGIGVHPPSQRFVVTCEDEGGGDSGRVLTFPMAPDELGQHPAVAGLELFQDEDTSHPSAIQIDDDGEFVVAMAGGAGDLSHFRSVALDEAGQPAEIVRSVVHESGHIGAVGRATLTTDAVDATTFVIGCGYDCDTLSVYQAPFPGAFELDVFAPTPDLVVPGLEDDVGAYNSLHLVPRCEDDQPLLVASHGSRLDVWSLGELGTLAPTLSKIALREIVEDVVLWGDRPIFFEGMTLEITDEEGVFVWAAPHDFGNGSCPAGTRCMQYVYRCSFDA